MFNILWSFFRVGKAADKMLDDSKGAEKNYLPPLAKILFSTPLINTGQTYKPSPWFVSSRVLTNQANEGEIVVVRFKEGVGGGRVVSWRHVETRTKAEERNYTIKPNK